MGEWHKTGCVMCAQNCGLEVLVEKNRMVKVRPDKDNPRSEGYVCRKGLSVAYHQHHKQRLTHPLKRVGDKFEQISWDQAVDEIVAQLKSILHKHGPKSLAYMGGGGQGCHFEAAFGVRLIRGLGSHYHYNALGQELTGSYWVWGRALGRQNLIVGSDHHNTDMLLAIGWNGMMSHQMPQARRFLSRFAKDPEKLLVVIDPRLSETAKIADLHLPIRPGTDALLTRAMIAVILQEDWHDKEYIARHVSGFDKIVSLFADFDARGAIEACELDYDQVRDLCQKMATRKWSMHYDLGVLMNRHSTATTYLQVILLAICGRICVPGGNVAPGNLLPIASHSDERDSRTWRTVTTDYPAITGVFPPNVMPEEILSDHPERLRAVICGQSNPLRSYADTSQYEKAFKHLDLLVTAELAMTETAELSHYVLPARSAYESWDGTFFPWTYPGVFFQMRRPVVTPAGEPLEVSQIYTRLADSLGLIPDIPEPLYHAAKGDRLQFGMELLNYAQSEPKAMKTMPFVLAKTLGQELGSANLAALWGLLMTAPKQFQENAARAGFTTGMTLGEDIFQAILDHPEGTWIGRIDTEKNMERIRTEDGRINVLIPELTDWVQSIDASSEKKALEIDKRFPLVLIAGLHMDTNANTLMRNPAWNKDRRACTVTMNPKDADELNLQDGQMVKVTTEAGEVEIELQVTITTRPGLVVIPHGFGLKYNGQVYGANVNRLTKNTHRDKLAGTPIHRYVPCRVEAA
ncbi:MAG: molybdopterin-dependent oxidoreductase [Deltaproteobacteria bacterium]|nr:MAG: molybdopterin-dependent oxidoreductase [Deltaproteobacteria bacterium]